MGTGMLLDRVRYACIVQERGQGERKHRALLRLLKATQIVQSYSNDLLSLNTTECHKRQHYPQKYINNQSTRKSYDASRCPAAGAVLDSISYTSLRSKTAFGKN